MALLLIANGRESPRREGGTPLQAMWEDCGSGLDQTPGFLKDTGLELSYKRTFRLQVQSFLLLGH